MLVLTRKESETIHIGDEVVIKVIKTANGSIKLGIEAPDHVRILRGEVAEAAAVMAAPRNTIPSRQVHQPEFVRRVASDMCGEAI